MSAITMVALGARFVWGLGSATFEPANFLAYVTIQSNVAFAVTTSVAAVATLHKRTGGPILTSIRAGVLTCTVTSGLVFALIVWQSTQRGIRVDVPWSDILLHFVLPVIGFADWMLVPRPAVRMRVVVFVLGYVLVWGGLTVLRGQFVEWYPYYFLDPHQLESAGEFALSVAVALSAFTAVGAALVTVPNAAASVGEGGEASSDQRRESIGV